MPTKPRDPGKSGNYGKGFDKPAPAQDLIDKGRKFYCIHEGCSDGPGDWLPASAITGNNIMGWWHKGHIGHKVEVGGY